jgi:chorismate mutase
MPDALALTDDDLVRMEHRARRFSGAYTGTSGTLAADVLRLLAERRRLLEQIARLKEGDDSEPWWQQPHD